MIAQCGEFLVEDRPVDAVSAAHGVQHRWLVRRPGDDDLGPVRHQPRSVAEFRDAGGTRFVCSCEPAGDWCPHIGAVKGVLGAVRPSAEGTP